MERAARISLVILFCGMICAVPVTQAILELADDETPQLLELFSDWPTEEHLRRFESDLEEYSWFEEKIRPVYQLAAWLGMRDPGAKALVGRDGWFFFHPGVQYLVQPYYPWIEGEEIEGGDPIEVIVSFRDQLASRGIGLLVAPVPGKASIYPDELARLGEVSAADDVAANTRRFAAALRTLGVEVADLHTPLIEARPGADRRGEPLYMRSDTHWTGHGVRVAAAALAARIRAAAWFEPDATRERYRRERMRVVRRGDIPAMTRIPLREKLFSPETVDCFQVRAVDTNALYEDDTGSPILLLGDSFSRVFQTDEPRAAGLIANLAFELQMPLDSIVNDGGASTLVRQQLARAPDALLDGKKLVVWEFVERDIRFGMRGWQPIRLWPEEATGEPRVDKPAATPENTNRSDDSNPSGEENP